MGWLLQSTPNGQITWHNGGTTSYGAYIGTLPDQDVGVIVLTNVVNVGLPDAIGEWTFDRLHRKSGGRPRRAEARLGEGIVRQCAPPALRRFRRRRRRSTALAGDYTSGKLGTAKLEVDGDALTLTLTSGARLRLAAWNGDTFSVALVPEGRFAAVAAQPRPRSLGPRPVPGRCPRQVEGLHLHHGGRRPDR